MELTFEVEGAPKPSCVAEVVFRYYSLSSPAATARSAELRACTFSARRRSVSVSG